ncbi:MAG: adenylate/guanylate cyclase domain-containing protein [Gaiellaceae bacterium]
MADQPTGTVTLLFTDIEGSTRLVERLGAERYAGALDLHRQLLRKAFDGRGGYEVDYEGDAFFVAFASAQEAVVAAAEAQRALAAADWPEEGEIRVRMGIHTGEPLAAPPKYVGMDVHKAARVMAAGHGGQVLLTKATQGWLGGRVAMRELGTHRLKDLLQPEPLYQLLVPGLRKEFPALKTLGNRPNNLPVVPTAFIGRDCELTAVWELLARDGVRLLTLTGPGGIGKTRLALQTAADTVEDFRDGVYWVPFAPLRDPDLAAATMAQTLGLREEAGEPIEDTLGRYLAEKQLLLVLDNLEHVLTKARGLTAAILRAAPQVRVLTTSREALRISGEWLYEVPPLAVPDHDERTLKQNDAVSLFAGRAQAADAHFALTADNAPTVAEIVRRLEGLPLAIELAAARSRTLSPQALLGRLDDRLRLLTSGLHDADERQRTLRATIEWSFDLLTPDEQVLFGRLGLFVGGCRLEAAHAVCDLNGELGIETLEGITSLLEKSLLRRRDDPDGEPRYWMLETIREYSQSRLALLGHEEDVALRHARFFLAYARDAEGSPQRIDPAAYSRLAADLQNLRIALATLRREREGEFRDLAASLREFFEYQGLITEGERWLRLALSVSPVVDETAAKLQTGLSTLVRWRGDLAGSAAEADAAVNTARRTGDSCVLAAALRDGASVALNSGDYATAHVLLAEALALLETADADALLAGVLVNLADLALNEHRWSDAVALSAQGIETGREVNPASEAISHLNRGVALLELSELGEAAESLATGIRMANDLGMTLFIALPLTRLAEAVAGADPVRAARLLGASEALLKKLGAVNNPIEIEATERTSVRLRERLTANAFAEYHAEGSQLDQDAAVRLALAPEVATRPR